MAWFGRGKSNRNSNTNKNGPKSAAKKTALPKLSKNKTAAADKVSTEEVKASLSQKRKSQLIQSAQKVQKSSEKARSEKFESIVIRKIKKIVPHPTQSPKPEYRDLPGNYGDNLIYLLVRDPHWLYAYWEIQREHQEHMLARLNTDLGAVKSVLRVYDVTEKTENAPFFDIALTNMVDHWFISVEPNRSYIVDIGLLHPDGRFVVLARSNRVATPRSGMSEIVDEQWMGLDFDKLYALSGGFQVGKGSEDLSRMMEERLRAAISSGSGVGGITSGASERMIKKQRGFWFVLDCELIVYGATEPDAAVTMRGIPVKLRPDGTFTLRYALPDCRLVLECQATSADGIETRTITPIVQRHTERPAPIIREEAAR